MKTISKLVRSFFPKPVYHPSRRTAPRVKAFNLLKCLRSDDVPQEMITNVSNLSETGLQFFSTSAIKPGSFLNMLINMGTQEKRIPVTARVAWRGRIHGQQGVYRIGVSFLSMASEDRQCIRQFVRSLLVFA